MIALAAGIVSAITCCAHRARIATHRYPAVWRGVLSAGVILMVATLALNWDWLRSVGLAPILIAFVWTAVVSTVGVYWVRTEYAKRQARAALDGGSSDGA